MSVREDGARLGSLDLTSSHIVRQSTRARCDASLPALLLSFSKLFFPFFIFLYFKFELHLDFVMRLHLRLQESERAPGERRGGRGRLPLDDGKWARREGSGEWGGIGSTGHNHKSHPGRLGGGGRGVR